MSLAAAFLKAGITPASIKPAKPAKPVKTASKAPASPAKRSRTHVLTELAPGALSADLCPLRPRKAPPAQPYTKSRAPGPVVGFFELHCLADTADGAESLDLTGEIA